MTSSSSNSLIPNDRTIAVLNLPRQYNFGIDMKMWEIGEKFMGVSELTPGVHYVYYSSQQDEIRQGFYHFTSGNGEPGVFKWDPSVESLTVPNSYEERQGVQRATVSDVKFLTGLAPYNRCIESETAEMWEEATSFITRATIERIEPLNSAAFRSIPQKSDDIPKSNADFRTIFWTNIPRIKAPVGHTPAERSEFYLERSEYLQSVVRLFESPQEMIGELQASFILFLLGLNYDAFVQWKQILEVLLSCKEKAVDANIELFTDFTRALWFQIKQLPVDLMNDPTIMCEEEEIGAKRGSVFLVPLLGEFIEVCRDDSLVFNRQLQKNIDRIDKEMKLRFGSEWMFDYIPSQDEPLIV